MAAGEVDILVIGGGVVGAGCALDAVTRGLTTAVVEAWDWASGTSSRSSKLIHGGLRYLEMLDFGLVREAFSEWGLLLDRIAPHLVRPVRSCIRCGTIGNAVTWAPGWPCTTRWRSRRARPAGSGATGT